MCLKIKKENAMYNERALGREWSKLRRNSLKRLSPMNRDGRSIHLLALLRVTELQSVMIHWLTKVDSESKQCLSNKSGIPD
jgi:hypothetical protein